MPAGTDGSSWQWRCTAGPCSTRGSIATWAWPAGSSRTTARPRWYWSTKQWHVPQLAIHLDRDITERGLILDKQVHLAPVWGIGAPSPGEFAAWIAAQAGLPPDTIATWDLCLFDRTKAQVLGPAGDLLAAGRLDNQLSCWAATVALCAAPTPTDCTAVIALFDHEEVGSESTSGAAGPLLEHVLERLALASGADRSQFLAQLAASSCISADNAHSVHPNYPERHEPGHRPLVNRGPAIKLNSNQRYATSADTAAMVQRVFDAAGVPWQTFVSRNNMPCGSTIGPITATRLGIDTVDVGVPQLSMHSARELCGTHDPIYLASALQAYFEARLSKVEQPLQFGVQLGGEQAGRGPLLLG